MTRLLKCNTVKHLFYVESRLSKSLHYADQQPIKVPGYIGESWSHWIGGVTITVECEGDGLPVTTVTATLEQAALQGLLRRLYALGLPLISVHCVED